MTWPKHTLTLVFLGALVLASGQWGYAYPAAQSPAQSAPRPALETPEQLQQLVAPIALYPDELVAQILAASTYPTQIVEADRWLQQHANLQGNALATAVDKQPWDASVKALTQFPSVLANLDQNLSWTSALGDAYISQPQEVLSALQVMRKRAHDAGTLKSTAQQAVTTQGQTVIIEPASPQVVYIPEYNPWIVYGAPLAVYPGYIAEPGLTRRSSPSASAYPSAPLLSGAAAGDGTHGASIGTTGPSSTTTRRISPGAPRSSTVTTSTASTTISDRSRMNPLPRLTTTCGVQGSLMARAYLTETLSTMVHMLVISGSRTA